MEIAHACQVQVEELVNQDFDLIVLGNKHNDRSSFLLRNYHIRTQHTLVLIDTDDKKEIRKIDPKLPPVHGLDVLEISSNDGERVVEFLETITSTLRQNELCILIDYSCLTKRWYASIINYLYLKEISCERINVYFAYIPVSYSEPRKLAFKRDLNVILKDPIYINSNITQKALVLGLGYDVEKAEFLIHKVKPAIIYYFFSQPAFDERYTAKVLDLNNRLIHNKTGNLIPYPMSDMDKTVELLTRLVLDLRLNYQVVLASFGPKLLTLACLLLFARFPDIEILSAGSERHSQSDGGPINTPIIYKAVFLTDEKCE
jgi:hypothetical protein